MFKSFFLSRRWWAWSIAGSVFILLATWYRVELDVQINDWFGTFYDLIQTSLGRPGSITAGQFWGQLSTFSRIAMVYVTTAVVVDFFCKHYIFRWRQAMNEHYMAAWPRLRHIEGAAQRVQEDTMRFATTMEGLGLTFLRSLMTLGAFVPVLWVLSDKLTGLPVIGAVPHSLVWVALFWALGGTLLLALVGVRLPGLEFHNQRVEAAYRKELVLGEDDPARAAPPTAAALFADVRRNYFRLFFNYLYFDVVKWSYLQVSVLVPLVALGPTLIAGAITLGVMQQISRAFDRVLESFQFLVQNWSTVVEQISIHKRLRAFERQMLAEEPALPEPAPAAASR